MGRRANCCRRPAVVGCAAGALSPAAPATATRDAREETERYGNAGDQRWAAVTPGGDAGRRPRAGGGPGDGAGGCRLRPGGEQPAAPSDRPVTLRFVPAGFHADLDQIVVDQYHAENPNVTVSFEPIPTAYVDKITALQAGTTCRM